MIMNNSFIAPADSQLNGANGEWDANSKGLCTGGLVDLNKVVQQILEEQQSGVSQAIIRCDALPLVQGRSPEVLSLFRELITLILGHPPRNSKLFIYLKCEHKATDIIDMTVPEGYAEHELCFYTNSNITPEWEQSNNDTLARCQQLTRESKGFLNWQTAPGAGCLFMIHLPGKTN